MDDDYVLKMRLSRKAWFGHFTGRRSISIKERIIHLSFYACNSMEANKRQKYFNFIRHRIYSIENNYFENYESEFFCSEFTYVK